MKLDGTAVDISKLLRDEFRARSWPVLCPHVAPFVDALSMLRQIKPAA